MAPFYSKFLHVVLYFHHRFTQHLLFTFQFMFQSFLLTVRSGNTAVTERTYIGKQIQESKKWESALLSPKNTFLPRKGPPTELRGNHGEGRALSNRGTCPSRCDLLPLLSRLIPLSPSPGLARSVRLPGSLENTRDDEVRNSACARYPP